MKAKKQPTWINQEGQNQPIACAFYRISTDKQGTDRQIEDVRQYCKAYGYFLPKENEFEEVISGASTLEKRTVLQSMLAYVEKNRPKYVICSELSRLARSQDSLVLIKNWTAQGICFISLKENIKTLDVNGNKTPMTDLLLGILTAINIFELDTIQYRVKSGLNKTVRQGTWSGGNPPFGYSIEDKRLVMCPAEAQTLEFMFKKYSEGWGSHKIASYLNLQGTTTKEGKSWVDSKIYKILSNPICIGKRMWNAEAIEMPEARIISDGLYYQVQERLQKNQNTTDLNKHNKYDYALAGKITCACGKSWVGQGRHGVYLCKSKKYSGGCSTKPVKIHWLEGQIKEQLISNQAKLIYDNTRLVSKVNELQSELQVLESDLKAEKRTQQAYIKSIVILGQQKFDAMYQASEVLQKKISDKIKEIQKKLEQNKKAESAFFLPDAQIDWGTIHIEKEVLQRVIDNISISNESIDVALVNGNTFSIQR
jgi:site-specific DNA recombinase